MDRHTALRAADTATPPPAANPFPAWFVRDTTWSRPGLYHDTEYRDHDVDVEVCEPVQVQALPGVARMACVVHHGLAHLPGRQTSVRG